MTMNQFKSGDFVRTIYGQIRTVLFQRDCQVFVAEESNTWYHPSNLHLVKVKD
jgi:hypothetical protein